MISLRCRYKARGSVLIRIFTSSSVRWAAARVTLAISSLFCFRSSPPLFYHSTRIRMNHESPVKKLVLFMVGEKWMFAKWVYYYRQNLIFGFPLGTMRLTAVGRYSYREPFPAFV